MRRATVVAGSDCKAVCIPRNALQFLIRKHPFIWKDIVKMAMERETYNLQAELLSAEVSMAGSRPHSREGLLGEGGRTVHRIPSNVNIDEDMLRERMEELGGEEDGKEEDKEEGGEGEGGGRDGGGADEGGGGGEKGGVEKRREHGEEEEEEVKVVEKAQHVVQESEGGREATSAAGDEPRVLAAAPARDSGEPRARDVEEEEKEEVRGDAVPVKEAERDVDVSARGGVPEGGAGPEGEAEKGQEEEQVVRPERSEGGVAEADPPSREGGALAAGGGAGTDKGAVGPAGDGADWGSLDTSQRSSLDTLELSGARSEGGRRGVGGGRGARGGSGGGSAGWVTKHGAASQEAAQGVGGRETGSEEEVDWEADAAVGGYDPFEENMVDQTPRQDGFGFLEEAADTPTKERRRRRRKKPDFDSLRVSHALMSPPLSSGWRVLEF